MIDKVYRETKDKMEKAIEALRKELSRIRTGRATSALLDGIRVQYYGSLVPFRTAARSPSSPGTSRPLGRSKRLS
jgi:ribosome recycling factor